MKGDQVVKEQEEDKTVKMNNGASTGGMLTNKLDRKGSREKYI